MPDIEPVSIPLARLFAACWEAFQGGVGIDPLDLETMLSECHSRPERPASRPPLVCRAYEEAMQKIPTMFERDWNGDRSRVVDVPHKDCGRVFAGEGIPTRKIDGTCCMIRDRRLFKRRELKTGQKAPEFEAVSTDEETGKTVGWVPVGDGPEDKWHRAAFDVSARVDGTYELVGPNVQGNPEHYEDHRLVPHSALRMPADDQPPLNFNSLRAWMELRDIEGVVFHHADGRMAKIKLRDFGLKRGQP